MAAGADILVEVRFERGAEFRQVQAAVDTAELVIGFEHPGGAPAQRHGPVPPAVESAWGAVPGLPRVRFPRPLAEPAVRLSTQRALHGCCRQAGLSTHRLGMLLPR